MGRFPIGLAPGGSPRLGAILLRCPSRASHATAATTNGEEIEVVPRCFQRSTIGGFLWIPWENQSFFQLEQLGFHEENYGSLTKKDGDLTFNRE